jgi:two-component system CheB/CheR fusion protein
MSPTNDAAHDPAFEHLLEYILRERGFDFTGYKRSSLIRRVRKRMFAVAKQEFADYQHYLETHPDEFVALFNTILINVTSFFRDREAWDYVAQEVIPRILHNKERLQSVRVWSVGCATGEEPYSIAILLAEAMGHTAFRTRVKIYATDVDDEALAQARHAGYSEEQLEPLDPELRERYFEPVGGHLVFRTDLRRSIIFGRHDLMQDAPISRLDLVICRNTLMYFNSHTQGRILSRFHFALNEDGFLFLGKAEMLLARSALFTPLDITHRVFVKVASAAVGDRLMTMAEAGGAEVNQQVARLVRLRESAWDQAPVAQIVVDAGGALALANQQARALFGVNVRDVGRSLVDLPAGYRPVELLPHLDRAYAERRAIVLERIEYIVAAEVHYLNVHIVPLLNDSGLLGAAVSFHDVTQIHDAEERLERLKQELETATEELQSTNEELETTNEELQSTVEELETTNEELQSTNEELETMNAEMLKRGDELRQATAFSQSILDSLDAALVVLDHGYRVLSWNRAAEELWGLRSDEVGGAAFFSLDIGLPLDKLMAPVRATMAGEGPPETVVLDAVNRRGRAIQVRVDCMSLMDGENQRQGAMLRMEALS